MILPLAVHPKCNSRSNLSMLQDTPLANICLSTICNSQGLNTNPNEINSLDTSLIFNGSELSTVYRSRRIAVIAVLGLGSQYQ